MLRKKKSTCKTRREGFPLISGTVWRWWLWVKYRKQPDKQWIALLVCIVGWGRRAVHGSQVFVLLGSQSLVLAYRVVEVGVLRVHILKGGTVCVPTVKLRRNWRLNFLSFNRERKMFARSSCYLSQRDTFISVPRGIQNPARREERSSFHFLWQFFCLVAHRGQSGGRCAQSTDSHRVKPTTGCWHCTHRRVVRSPLGLKE